MSNASKYRMHQVPNNANGNPRWVISYLAISRDYVEAARLAKSIGGKPYRGKDFGGGIAFAGYSRHQVLCAISNISKSDEEDGGMITEISVIGKVHCPSVKGKGWGIKSVKATPDKAKEFIRNLPDDDEVFSLVWRSEDFRETIFNTVEEFLQAKL